MTYNGEKWLRKCIDSFFTFLPLKGVKWEWIILDNGSRDKTKYFVQSIQQKNDGIKYYELNDNSKSFSFVNNMGTKISSGKYLFFVNNDIEFLDSLSVKNMINALERNNAGCVGSRLMYPDRSIQHAGVIYRNNRLPWNVRKGVSERYLSYDREYQAVTAACMICKKSDFESVGGFDERYYFCFEDVDLCLKMKKTLKKKTIYCSRTKFIHHESRTILALNNKKQKFVEAARVLRKKWDSFVDIDEMKYINNKKYKTIM